MSRIGQMGRILASLHVQSVTDRYAKVREVTRKFTKVRTDQGRGYAMVWSSQARHKLDAPSGLFASAKRGRIVTGGTNFLRSKAGDNF